MVEFYGDALGLERIDGPPSATSAFFRVGNGVDGHVQVLALFDRTETSDDESLDAGRSTVYHAAFGIRREGFESGSMY